MKTELTPVEKFHIAVTKAYAQAYSDAISENVKRALASRKQNLSTPQSSSVKKSKV